MSGKLRKRAAEKPIPLKLHKGYVRLKAEEVLMLIFVRGLLNQNEMRIVLWVICDSWRWGGRKTTRSLVVLARIARESGIPLPHVSRTWKRLVERNVIVEYPEKGKAIRASFNEHVDTWIELSKCNVTKLVTPGYQIGKGVLPNTSHCPPKRHERQGNTDTLRTSKKSLRIKAMTTPSSESSKSTANSEKGQYGLEFRAITALWDVRFPEHKRSFSEYGMIRKHCERKKVSPVLFIERMPADHLAPWKLACGYFADEYPWPEPTGENQKFIGWQKSLANN